MPNDNDNDLLRTLAKNLRRSRRSKGLTQEALAEAIGVSAPAVKSWEKGKRAIGLVRLKLLADKLDVPLDSLLGIGGRRFIEDPGEVELLDVWRRLDGSDRQTILELAKKLGR